MTTPNDPTHDPADTPPPGGTGGAQDGGELDGLLREWHRVHADRAAAGRDRLLASLAGGADAHPAPEDAAAADSDRHRPTWRTVMVRLAPLAAAAAVLAAVVPFFLPQKLAGPLAPAVAKASHDGNVVMAPDGGRLDAFDDSGDLLGPCVLKHTDVRAEISGPFARVTVRQQYHNPHADKIEARYTFPLPHTAAVDGMRMVIGDRVVLGEVKERDLARQIYTAARESGRVASLLEQERPNIFTQSVANIDPGAAIDIEISYVETIRPKDGDYSFTFPTTVGPRYIPGSASASGEATLAGSPAGPALPAHLQVRRGLVLTAPARVTITADHAASSGTASVPQPALQSALASALPIRSPSQARDPAPPPGSPWCDFRVEYPDGSSEPGTLFTDSVGHVGGRWFYVDMAGGASIAPRDGAYAIAGRPLVTGEPGAPFAADTDQVPDASRVTPTPARPGTRAGHDLSISVTIDSGGPGITDVSSPLHQVSRTDLARNPDGTPRRSTVTLANLSEIPNRDFVLNWRQVSGVITDAVFTHAGDRGNFFAVLLNPPARVEDRQAVPRELVFVLDTSGSMSGYPIEKAKAVVARAIDGMRPQDTFNLVTFSGDTHVLWPRPRPNTSENRAEARAFLASRSGGGGTEMMAAIETALRQGAAGGDDASPNAAPLTPQALTELPADGRDVAVRVHESALELDRLEADSSVNDASVRVRPDLAVRLSPFSLPETYMRRAFADRGEDGQRFANLVFEGSWATVDGDRRLVVRSVRLEDVAGPRPLRIVTFFTDGFVGNDMAIVEAIRRNRATTRVFSFGIGNSVNRSLLDGMAEAGGGAADYVLIPQNARRDADRPLADRLDADADRVVARFNRRTQSPVLIDISLAFSPGLDVLDVVPAPDRVPDLFDSEPLLVLGRYTSPGAGTLTIRGTSAAGAWQRDVPLDLPAGDIPGEQSAVVPTLWARASIESLMSRDLAGAREGAIAPDLKARIVQLGTTFGIMSRYTSFVAVDYARVTVAGRPRLVPIPVELPDATRWEGFFGTAPQVASARGAVPSVGFKLELRRGNFAPGFQVRHTGPTAGKPAEEQTTGDGLARYSEVPEVDLESVLQQSQGGRSSFLEERFAQISLGEPVSGPFARGELGDSQTTSNMGPVSQGAAVSRGGAAAGQEKRDASAVIPESVTNCYADPDNIAHLIKNITGGAPTEPADSPKTGGSAKDEPQSGETSVTPHQTPPAEARSQNDPELSKGGRGNATAPATAPPAAVPSGSEDGSDARRAAADAEAPLPPTTPDPAQTDTAAAYYEHVSTTLDRAAAAGLHVPHALAAAHATVYITDRADESQFLAATTAAELFANRYPDHALLARLRSILTDGALDAAGRRAAVVALRPDARALVDRELALLRRLDTTLYARVRPAPGPAPAAQSDAAADALRTLPSLQIVALVESLDDAAAARLADAGLTIDAREPGAAIVLGRIAPDQLEALALVPGIKRIQEVGGAASGASAK